jgi:hypothetical protein
MMLPVYGALHLIPTLVLRRQHFVRDPIKMLARVALGVTRSCSFLGIYVVIYQGRSSVTRSSEGATDNQLYSASGPRVWKGGPRVGS